MKFYVTNDKNNLTEIYDAGELAEKVLSTIRYYEECYDKMTKENKEWREEAYEKCSQELKDEIKQLKQELSMSYGFFSSKKEKEAYADFAELHMHDRRISKANGGKVPYLIPNYTGIGVQLTVVCPICGDKMDITDTEAW